MKTNTRAAENPAVDAPAERILCAVDFSRHSLAALQTARRLARRWDSKLELLCAADLPAMLDQNAGSAEESRLLDGFHRRLRDRLRAFAGDDVAFSVWDGPADRAIVEAARKRGAGLIVLGTHGRAGLPRLMLGSVAEAVIAETGLPVLVVHQARDAAWPRRILVPMKAADYADQALVYGDRFARSVGAELGVVHIIEAGSTKSSIDALGERVKRGLGRPADFRARESRYEPAEAILREAERGGFDLIVMAAHRKPYRRYWRFGMTVQRLLRYSTVPLISVGGLEPPVRLE